MKTLMYTTAAVFALSGAAMAQDQLRAAVQDEFVENGFSVDVDSLTDEQVNEIYALTTSDNSNVRGDISKILMDGGYARMEMGESTIFVAGNSLRDAVEIQLEGWGYEIEADTLTDEQIAGLYPIVTGASEDDARAKIDAILQ